MTKEIKVPELGEGIETVDVISILVKKGDILQAQQAILEVESDKASLELPSPVAGTVIEILVQTGQKIKTGQNIALLSTSSSDTSANQGKESPASEPKKSQKKSQKKPEKSKESPKPSLAPTTPITSNAPLELSSPRKSIAAAPSVRRLARELGADIYRITGSGHQGRISQEDVKSYVKEMMQQGIDEEGRDHPKLPEFSRFGKVNREKMSSIRKRTSEKMQLSWNHIPHVTQFEEADITALEQFRRKKNKEAEKHGIKLTITTILIKIMALALRRFPKFNSSIDMKYNEIIYKEYVHLGIAVDTLHGLLVPVLRDADKKDLFSIATELDDLAKRSRKKKIKPEELQGSCMSLTNLGGLGTTYFTPLINWPEVSVLGIGRAKNQAILMHGSFQPRLILPLSLSYDHRLIDGADAARFLHWIAETLEYPMEL